MISQCVEDIERFFELQKFKQIVACQCDTLVLLSNGELYAFGSNDFGQLGLGHTNSVSTPTLVEYFKGKSIQQMVAGGIQMFVLLSNGELYAFGYNRNGQLGLGHTKEKVSNPTPVNYFKGKSPIQQIVAGGFHTLVLLSNGELYAFGSNLYGQLGLGHTNKVSTPTRIGYFKGKSIQQIVAGSFHTLVLLSNGELYAFGRNEDGQLGLGHTNKVLTPTLVDYFKGKSIQQIFAGGFVLLSNGELYAFGDNAYGQLGLGYSHPEKTVLTPTCVDYFKGKSPIQQIVAGRQTLVLLSNGELYAFGYNYDGRLGLRHTHDVYTPTHVDYFKGKSPIQQIVAGNHTLVLLSNGELYVFGYNGNGQLGLGHTKEKVSTPAHVDYFKGKEESPIQQIVAGLHLTFVLLSNGELHAFGDNSYGQLGLGHTNDVSTPTLVEFFSKVAPIRSIHTSSLHTIVILKSHQIFSFGQNLFHQLALSCDNQQESYSTPQEITRFAQEQIQNLSKVELGEFSTCFHFSDGSVCTVGKTSNQILEHVTNLQNSQKVLERQLRDANDRLEKQSSESIGYHFGQIQSRLQQVDTDLLLEKIIKSYQETQQALENSCLSLSKEDLIKQHQDLTKKLSALHQDSKKLQNCISLQPTTQEEIQRGMYLMSQSLSRLPKQDKQQSLLNRCNVWKSYSTTLLHSELDSRQKLEKLSQMIECAKTNRKDLRKSQRKLEDMEDEGHDEATMTKAEEKVKAKRQSLTKLNQDIETMYKEVESLSFPLHIRQAQELKDVILSKKNDRLKTWLLNQNLIISRTMKDYDVKHNFPQSNVSLCCRLSDNKQVIIKKLPIASEDNRKVARNEVALLSRFADYNHIIDLNGVFIDRSKVCLELPFYSDGHFLQSCKNDLKSDSKELRSLPLKQPLDKVLHMLHQVVQGLGYLHSNGIEHNDVKPENIMIDGSNVRLIDFGISHDHHSLITSFGTTLDGAMTLRYASPEKREMRGNQFIFGARDVYALGITMIECFNPAIHDRLELLNGSVETGFDSLFPTHEGFNGWVRDLCGSMVALDPKERPSIFAIQSMFNKGMLEKHESNVSNIVIPFNKNLSLIKSTVISLRDKHVSSGSDTIKLDRKDTLSSIIKVMSDVKNIRKLLREWFVRFNDESAFGPGVGRDFLHESMECIFDPKNGLFVKSESNDFFQCSDEKDCSHEMRAIGRLFARCFIKQYGVLFRFDSLFFEAISRGGVDKIPESLTFLMEKVESYDQQVYLSMNKMLKDPESMNMDLKEASEVVVHQCRAIFFGLSHRKSNLKALYEGFVEFLPDEFRTFMLLVRLTWKQWFTFMCGDQALSSKQMHEALRSALNSDEWKNAECRQYILDWIASRSNDDYRRLLCFMTGLPVLPNRSQLSLTPSDRFHGHTCSHNMEVNCTLDDSKKFGEQLDFYLLEQGVSGMNE